MIGFWVEFDSIRLKRRKRRENWKKKELILGWLQTTWLIDLDKAHPILLGGSQGAVSHRDLVSKWLCDERLTLIEAR